MIEFLLSLNQAFTFFVIFPFVLVLGILMSVKLKFAQIFKLPLSFKYLLKPNEGQGSITHYEAISAVLAGNFGTGNISGMAVAVATGGPGALVWMWVMAFLGSIIQFSSCYLGVKYREKNEQGEYVGGPMYYLRSGLGSSKLAIIFSACAIVGAILVGNFAQGNSVALPLESLGLKPHYVGLFLALISGFVILGGISRFAKVASSVVPLMALVYFMSACVILWRFRGEIPGAFSLIISSAFSMKSAFSGVLGYGLFKALSTGFERGVFATDVGTGLAPILQAGAQTKSPLTDAVISLIAPFMVMIVCTTTALVILVTGSHTIAGLKSTNVVTHAFTLGLDHDIGRYIVIGSLFLFAYTTILAWSCVAEKAWGFIFGTKHIKKLQLFFISLIPFGTVLHVDLIWHMADIVISCMLAINLWGIYKLFHEVHQDTYLELKVLK